MSMRAAVSSSLAASGALPNGARSCSTVNFRVTRELLKHKTTYNDSIRPFLQGLSSHTHGVLRYLPPHLLSVCRDEETRQFLSLEAILRKRIEPSVAAAAANADAVGPAASSSSISRLRQTEAKASPYGTTSSSKITRSTTNPPGSSTAAAAAIDLAEELAAAAKPDPKVALGLEALSTINLFKERLAMTDHKSLLDVPYDFNVGDLVVHKDLRQLGVVAARLPVCLESESWVTDNIGGLQDKRMAHPWYLILVAHHAGLPLDFVRYGSQLTHTKMADSSCKPIGFHRLLPLYFQGYDMEEGRYIPRGKLPVKPEPAPVEPLTEAELLSLASDNACFVVDDDADFSKNAEIVGGTDSTESASSDTTRSASGTTDGSNPTKVPSSKAAGF